MRSPGLFGGYKNIAILAIVLWVLAFFVVYRFGRKPKTDTNLKPVARPPTFAERIRPLLERAAWALPGRSVILWTRHARLAPEGVTSP